MELEKKTQPKERICEQCKSIEGELRKVGNYVVELSEIYMENETRLLCQGCKIKIRNLRTHVTVTERSKNGIKIFKVRKTKKH